MRTNLTNKKFQSITIKGQEEITSFSKFYELVNSYTIDNFRISQKLFKFTIHTLPNSQGVSLFISNIFPINIYISTLPVLPSLSPVNNSYTVLRDNPALISSECIHGWFEGGSVTIIMGRVSYLISDDYML